MAKWKARATMKYPNSEGGQSWVQRGEEVEILSTHDEVAIIRGRNGVVKITWWQAWKFFNYKGHKGRESDVSKRDEWTLLWKGLEIGGG